MLQKPIPLFLFFLPSINGHKYAKYQCCCGNLFEARLTSVKNGKTSSCGCFKKMTTVKRLITHGDTNTRLYNIWKGIKDRVLNPKCKHYVNYGQRGISIYHEWKYDFMSFKKWSLENGYQDDLTIDRKNNDGDYTPLNCRWVSKKIQARNTRLVRSTNKSGFKGVSKLNKKWLAKIGVNHKSIHLGCFDTPKEAALAYDNYVIKHSLEHSINFSKHE